MVPGGGGILPRLGMTPRFPAVRPAVLLAACTAFAPAILAAACSSRPANQSPPGQSPAQAPAKAPTPVHVPTPEEKLRAEVATWKSAPYVEGGTARTGVDQPGFVATVFKNVFGAAIPETQEEQIRTGKLVERTALAPGDLVFFDGKGFGPFRPHLVAIFVGHDEAAIAQKTVGVSVVKVTDPPWTSTYKTARRIGTSPSTGAPTFDAQAYGSNRGALLRDVAKAWSGTLYRAGGTTFDGIDNDEFVREVYSAVNDTDLDGTPKQWATMGQSVPRDQLEPGDIILYQGSGFGGLFNQRQAGLYIGGGQFVHAVRGAAVTISKMDDPRWSNAFKDARRIDPEALARAEEQAAAGHAATPARPAPRNSAPTKPTPANPTPPSARPTASARPTPAHAALVPLTSPGEETDTEREARLRDAAQPWMGTPYRLGGDSRTGIDCSAFVQAIFLAAYNMDLPRSADTQEEMGTAVSRNDLEAGDLVFFRTQGMGPLFKSHHVGLYVGDGEFAQASSSHGVMISRLDNVYWTRKYQAARRILPATSHH
jgi:cell wall-associated NlpC family hydrolase